MRRIIIVGVAATLLPVAARAQAPAAAASAVFRTRFSVNGVAGSAGGPRLELDRAVTRRLALSLGASAELRNPFGTSGRRMSAIDVAAKYYLGPRALTGLYGGLRLGYERLTAPSTSGNGYPAGPYSEFLAGYDRSIGRRLTLATSVGVQPAWIPNERGLNAKLRPRIGLGWRF